MAVSAERSEPPTLQLGDDQALVYTMRDLNQETVRIIHEIEAANKPAFIARHGRFVAIITPVTPGQVESQTLIALVGEIVRRDRSQ